MIEENGQEFVLLDPVVPEPPAPDPVIDGSVDTSVPESASGGEVPVPEDPPASDPGVTESEDNPVEVVSVDELVDRLTGTDQPEQEAAEAPETFFEAPVSSAVEIAGMDELLGRLEMIQGTVEHPALETPFEEYTVTEGLLLLLLVLVIVSWCVKMIKGGFSWLLW